MLRTPFFLSPGLVSLDQATRRPVATPCALRQLFDSDRWQWQSWLASVLPSCSWGYWPRRAHRMGSVRLYQVSTPETFSRPRCLVLGQIFTHLHALATVTVLWVLGCTLYELKIEFAYLVFLLQRRRFRSVFRNANNRSTYQSYHRKCLN